MTDKIVLGVQPVEGFYDIYGSYHHFSELTATFENEVDGRFEHSLQGTCFEGRYRVILMDDSNLVDIVDHQGEPPKVGENYSRKSFL